MVDVLGLRQAHHAFGDDDAEQVPTLPGNEVALLLRVGINWLLSSHRRVTLPVARARALG